MVDFTREISPEEAMGWFDAVDYRPLLVCEVELRDGSIIDAYYAVGSWHTIDDKEISDPVRFRAKAVGYMVPVYGLPKEFRDG